LYLKISRSIHNGPALTQTLPPAWCPSVFRAILCDVLNLPTASAGLKMLQTLAHLACLCCCLQIEENGLAMNRMAPKP
jgi:hypothetical protein